MKMNQKLLMVSLSSVFHDGRVNTYIQKLNEMGYEVVVISLKQGRNEKTIERKKFTNYKIARRYIGNSKPGYIWFYLKFFTINLFLTTYLTIKHKIKIIHYNNSPNFIILSCFPAKLFFGARLILDNHDIVSILVQSKFQSKALLRMAELEEKVSFGIADKILCADHNQYDYFANGRFEKRIIIPIMNIPNKKIFNSVRKESESNEFNMVYHGTISYRLGQDLILDAISLIKNDVNNFKFHLIGKGDTINELKSICNKHKLEDYVIIYDKFIPIENLPEVLEKMTVGIIPYRNNLQTRQYGFPVKLLEYIELRIPVITPRFPIITRYFTEDMLCFYEPENIEEMAKKILFLYKNKEAREKFAVNAYQFTEKYNYETEMSKYEAVIKQLMV